MLGTTSSGGKINHKGAKERGILFCGVAAPRQRAAIWNWSLRLSAEEPLRSRFARDDFPHGLHVQLVLVAPGILFEKNEVGGRKIRDADTAGFQKPQGRTKIVERIFGELENKSLELLQPNQLIAGGRKTPDHFVDRLLHRLNLRFHQIKLNPIKSGWSTPRRGEFYFAA